MEDKAVVHIALTGHRPSKLGGYDIETQEYKNLQNDLEDIIELHLANFDIIWGHSGLALGADSIWSKAILNMKTIYPGRVLLHAEIPMMTQSSRWTNKDKEFWYEQIDKCDKRSLYSYSAPNEQMDKYMVSKALKDRNIGMVDHADVVIAIWDGSNSGTKHAHDHAKKTGKEIIHIYPSDYFK